MGALVLGDLVLLLSGPHPLAVFAACVLLGAHWGVLQVSRSRGSRGLQRAAATR